MTIGSARKTVVTACALVSAISAAATASVSPLFAVLIAFVALFRLRQPAQDALSAGVTFRIVLPLVAMVVGLTLGTSLTGNILGGFSSTIALILALRLWVRFTPHEDDHIVLLSGVLFLASAAQRQDLVFGICFVLYILLFVPASYLSSLAKESTNLNKLNRVEGGGAVIWRSAPVGVSLLIATAILFLLIPRVGFGYGGTNDPSALSMSGFNDKVTLGGHGTIKLDSTIVMRVEVNNPQYEGRNAPALHWRGTALDRYSAGTWYRSDKASRTEANYTRLDRHTIRRELFSLFNRRPAQQVLEQTIFLEPYGHQVLFASMRPFRFDLPQKRGYPSAEWNDEIKFSRDGAIRYKAYSAEPLPPEELRLMDAAEDDNNLQVPPEMREPLAAIAVEITKGQSTTYDKIRAVEKWLQGMNYTTQLDNPQGDPVLHFLENSRSGHCELFASSMVLLLRALDIPARVVNGFYGGEWNEYENFIAVRAGDAHSWVEVNLKGYGWVEFDPTPSSSVDLLGRGKESFMAKVTRFVDSLRYKWRKWVLDYNFDKQKDLWRKTKAAVAGAFRWLWSNILLFSVVGLALLLLLALFRSRKDRFVSSKETTWFEKEYRKALQLQFAKVPKYSWETEMAYVRRVGNPESLQRLTEEYYRVKFGGAEILSKEEVRKLCSRVAEQAKTAAKLSA